MDNEIADNCYTPAPAPASAPKFAAPIFQRQCYQPEPRPKTPVVLPSLRLHCALLAKTQLPRITGFNSLNSSSSVSSANGWASFDASSPSSASSFSGSNVSPGKRTTACGTWSPTPPPPPPTTPTIPSAAPMPLMLTTSSASPTMPSLWPGSRSRHSFSTARSRRSSSCTTALSRSSPGPRLRQVRALRRLPHQGRPDQRLHRTHRSCGLEEILKIGPDGSMGDRRKVGDNTAHLSRVFLNSLG